MPRLRLNLADYDQQKLRDLIIAIDRELPRYIEMIPDSAERRKIEKQRARLMDKMGEK